MPLQHLGQLKPTMQQQIALQEAMLKLAREDDTIRARLAQEMARSAQQQQPRATQDYGGGASPGSYAGPTSSLGGEAFRGGMTYSQQSGGRPGAGSLQEALRAAQPSPEGQPTAQTEAWKRRDELEQERTQMAKGLYDRLLPLDEEGREIVLDAVRKSKPELIREMQREGYMSQDGRLSEAEKEPKSPVSSSQWTDEQGWLQQTVLFDDGTSETKQLGREAKKKVETGMSTSDQIAWARLNFDIEKEGTGNVLEAIKGAGGIIVEGDMIKRPGDNNYKKANVEDVARRDEKIRTTLAYNKMQLEGIRTPEDLTLQFQYDVEAIKNFQLGLGLTVDGVWSNSLRDLLFERFYKEE